ncbi:MAG: mannose-1-phosphate guanylyltransferase, partial [Phycisphaerales bacterium]|nr:mannose-1-phosphate guanylyltransferase [Phycisphaerales bacterium]
RLITFAITPTYAATGFGYVERGAAITGVDGAYHAAQFVEKPDEATATEFIASGRWGWNSGMFIFHAGTLMDAVRRFKPESCEPLLAIASAYGTTSFRDVLNEVYPTLAKVSVDYGVMEPASHDDTLSIITIPMDVQWRDIGSWPSFGETLDADAHGNRTTARAVHLDSHNVLAVSDDPSHTIATIGCDDLIIVRTKDATLVCRADRAQDVKAIADLVDAAREG